MIRDGLGRFRRLVCVNAHDRCYACDECPWCEFSPIPDMHEAERLASCEAFALTERWNANAAKFWKRRDQERAR